MPSPAKARHSSSLTSHARRDGTEVFIVRYRHDDGSSTSRSFDTEVAARRWQAFLGTVGPRDAEKSLDEAGTNSSEIAGIKSPQAGMTVRDFAEFHFDTQTKANQYTVETYRRSFRNGLESLAHVPIGSLTKLQVIGWVKNRSEEVASKTVRNEHSTLSGVLRRAMNEGVIAQNIARGIPIEDGLRKEMTFLTPAEFKELLTVVPERWRHVPLLLAGTGLRWGELTALTAENVDVKRRTLRVAKAWKYIPRKDGIPGHWYIGPPKSKRAMREIAMTDAQVEVFAPLLKGKGRDDLLITAIEGGPLRQSKFYAHIWAPVRNLINGLDAYPIPDPDKPIKYRRDRGLDYTRPLNPPLGKWPRVHDLRHSHASWMLEQGLSFHVLQYRLGHESIATTVDRYGHLPPTSQGEARQALDRAMVDLV